MKRPSTQNRDTMEESLHIISDKFEIGDTGEIVDGVTIMIDGMLKQVFDVLIQRDNEYNSYPEIVRDILFSGMQDFMNRYKA